MGRETSKKGGIKAAFLDLFPYKTDEKRIQTRKRAIKGKNC